MTPTALRCGRASLGVRVGHVPQLVDGREHPLAQRLGDRLGAAVDDARRGRGGDAGPPGDVGQRHVAIGRHAMPSRSGMSGSSDVSACGLPVGAPG